MKTEELLRYEAEYRAMQEAFRTILLVFDFPKPEGNVKQPHFQNKGIKIQKPSFKGLSHKDSIHLPGRR